MIRTLFLFICSTLFAAGLCGCGEKGPPTGMVTGKVTIGGAAPDSPLLVNYSNSMTGQFGMSPTKPDGSYDLVVPLRTGEYKVYFDKPSDKDGPTSVALKGWNSVPKTYLSEESTPLKQTVVEGDNVFDLEIPKP
ncbi:hypothetical protein Pan44_48650 [Caulifigura coniformis]|uniref:Carboxypeptidase regulatory-like domain-containing protein n=1 Tax=Caulifigura coniformis TaxID=2527983 RepID=A0A517SL05_9PLAN|nr:hypothetical protein [Caulifigura coniformis]QDT56805.1 hypothetical protein Pan44_48650 [Caulifigura coniformis]